MKNNLKKKVASKIKTLRLKKGLTQEQMAELAGFHYKYFQKIEGGSVNLTLTSLEKIAAALKVSPKELFM